MIFVIHEPPANTHTQPLSRDGSQQPLLVGSGGLLHCLPNPRRELYNDRMSHVLLGIWSDPNMYVSLPEGCLAIRRLRTFGARPVLDRVIPLVHYQVTLRGKRQPFI